MRQMLNKICTFLLSFVFNVLLPIIIVAAIIAFVNFTTLTMSSNTDINSIIYRVRSNKSLFDLVASVHNTISLMATSWVGVLVYVKELKKSSVVDITMKLSFEDTNFIDGTQKSNLVIESKNTYLRI